jgi:hypothetical protein
MCRRAPPARENACTQTSLSASTNCQSGGFETIDTGNNLVPHLDNPLVADLRIADVPPPPDAA